MNNECRPEDAGINDPAVSATYAEIASQRAPASLNERVLRDASRHAGKGYSFWMVWMRPMAWAATVGLCLAIVIELSSITQPGPAIFESQLPGADAKRADDKHPVAAPDADQPNTKAEASKQLTAPARSNAQDANNNPAAGMVSGQGLRPEAPATEKDDVAETDMFQIREAPMLKEAEDMDRMRQGSDLEPEERAIGSGLAASAKAVPLADGAPLPDSALCDEQSRATRESWLDCIDELEQAGHDTAAERKALIAAFPDNEIP